MEKKKYLDYEGFKTYHNELVSELRDLTFDSQRMFDSEEGLLTLNNWEHDEFGRVWGLKEGLIITVDDIFWQLENPIGFWTILTRVGESPAEKAANYTIEELGWKKVGSTTEFDVDGHTLKLMKK